MRVQESTGSTDPTEIDRSYQGRATCAIPTWIQGRHLSTVGSQSTVGIAHVPRP